MKTVRFWGQLVKIDGNLWETNVKKTVLRRGEVSRVGLNERLVDQAARERARLRVNVLDKGLTFEVAATKFLKDSEVHNEPSRKKPGTTFKIYLYKIPREAFEDAVEESGRLL